MPRRYDVHRPGYLAVGGRDRLVYGVGETPELARSAARVRAIEAGEYALVLDEGFSVYWVDGDDVARHADLDGKLREPLRPLRPRSAFTPEGNRR
jgi:hypothetical protein